MSRSCSARRTRPEGGVVARAARKHSQERIELCLQAEQNHNYIPLPPHRLPTMAARSIPTPAVSESAAKKELLARYSFDVRLKQQTSGGDVKRFMWVRGLVVFRCAPAPGSLAHILLNPRSARWCAAPRRVAALARPPAL